MAVNTEVMPVAPGAIPQTLNMPIQDFAPLPQALRDSTLASEDLETLLRIAGDKNAPSGRYTGKPCRIPVSE